MPGKVVSLPLLCWVVLAAGCGRATNGSPAARAPSAAGHDAAAQAVPAFAVACAECHAEIVGHYARSGMSHSWRRVSPVSLVDTSLPATVADHHSGYRYEVRPRGGEVWQIETHQNDASHRRECRAVYQVGSGNHALAWLAAENGFLTELPVGWFGATAGWRMNPGYELKNHRFSRPVPVGCVGCHATQADHEAPTANRFALPVAEGIACTRCHNDAADHVAYHKSAGSAGSPQPSAAQLVHPGKLTSGRANDICLQCHLQGDVVVPRGGSSPVDFQPGDTLLDLRHDFLIAGQPEMLGVASHGARLLQSRCYVASGAKLTCIHCHDAHRPAADFDAAFYDTKCLACHEPQACQRPAANNDARTAKGCVSCHMPRRPTREGIHLVFTDHAIRRQTVDMASASPPVLAPNAAVELVSAWPDAQPHAATLGAAYVLLHETMGPQQAALERGRELLAEVLLTTSSDDSRYWLGSALVALGRPAEAREQLRRVLMRQPDWHEARYRLALAEEAAGAYPLAMQEYKLVLEACPHWPEPHARLAQLHLAERQPAAAAAVLKRLVALQPTAAHYASLALAERLAGQSHEDALALVEKALAQDSREPAAYVTRGTLWLLAGHPHEAHMDFERAIKIDPNNAAARQALETLRGR